MVLRSSRHRHFSNYDPAHLFKSKAETRLKSTVSSPSFSKLTPTPEEEEEKQQHTRLVCGGVHWKWASTRKSELGDFALSRGYSLPDAKVRLIIVSGPCDPTQLARLAIVISVSSCPHPLILFERETRPVGEIRRTFALSPCHWDGTVGDGIQSGRRGSTRSSVRPYLDYTTI